MQYMKLDGARQQALITALAGTHKFLSEAFASLSEKEARAPGPGGSFSPVEQVWHLADLEKEGFGHRILKLQTGTNPHLPDFDGDKIAKERNYKSLSFSAGLKAFAEARGNNLAIFLDLPEEAWNLAGTQEGVGPVSLCDMPVFLRQHDEAHIAEILAWKEFIRNDSNRPVMGSPESNEA